MKQFRDATFSLRSSVHYGRVVRVLSAAVLACCVNSVPGSVLAQHPIVMRDLSLLDDQVESFDQWSVKLRSGRQLMWDEILQADVGQQRRAAFDEHVRERGIPLLLLKKRLERGDFASLAPLTEKLYNDYRERPERSSLLVCMATARSRLKNHQPEKAIEPLLFGLDNGNLRNAAEPPEGNLLSATAIRLIRQESAGQIAMDSATGICDQLLPVQFRLEESTQAIGGLQQSEMMSRSPPSLTGIIYFASLSIAAGKHDDARKWINELAQTTRHSREWIAVLSAQLELATGQPGSAVKNLRENLQAMSPQPHACALFLLGKSDLSHAITSDAGQLQLLTIPAIYGDRFSELSADCLYLVAQFRARGNIAGNDDSETNSTKAPQMILQEILGRFPDSRAATRVRTELDSVSPAREPASELPIGRSPN